MEEEIICGQCNKDIVEAQEAYLTITDERIGTWYQCFDCYSEEYDYIYNSPDED